MCDYSALSAPDATASTFAILLLFKAISSRQDSAFGDYTFALRILF